MSLVSVILFGSCNIFTAYLFKNLADTAVYGTVSDLKRLIIISGLFILAYSCIALIRCFFLNKFINTAMVQYKNAIFNSLLYRKYNAFDSNITGKYLSAMTNDIFSIRFGINLIFNEKVSDDSENNIEPDLWVDPAEAEEKVILFMQYYQID